MVSLFMPLPVGCKKLQTSFIHASDTNFHPTLVGQHVVIAASATDAICLDGACHRTGENGGNLFVAFLSGRYKWI
jgi:hypothetical protein